MAGPALGSLCDVLPAAAALLSVPDAVDRLGVTESVGKQVDRVAVVLVDGLGWHLLPELAGSAPLLASVLAGGAGRLTQLTCTFPSTTPSSLVSLGTGAQPGEHGILGFTVNVPGTERVLTHIYWRSYPPSAGGSRCRPGSSGCSDAGLPRGRCCRRCSWAAD